MEGPLAASPQTRGLTHRVGVAGFEPTTSSSRTKRATKLRHTPMKRRKDSRLEGMVETRPPAGRPIVRFAQRATSVRSVASGRQANRTGA